MIMKGIFFYFKPVLIKLIIYGYLVYILFILKIFFSKHDLVDFFLDLQATLLQQTLPALSLWHHHCLGSIVSICFSSFPYNFLKIFLNDYVSLLLFLWNCGWLKLGSSLLDLSLLKNIKIGNPTFPQSILFCSIYVIPVDHEIQAQGL